jgi:hypothetical protein
MARSLVTMVRNNTSTEMRTMRRIVYEKARAHHADRTERQITFIRATVRSFAADLVDAERIAPLPGRVARMFTID